MRRQMLSRLIAQGLKYDLFACVGAYLLQYFNQQFAWLFYLAATVLFWLCIAWIASILDFLVNGDER